VAGVRATDTGVLWAAVLAGPVAWAVQLQTVYALAAPAGEGWSEAPLHVVSLLCLLAAAGGGYLAHRGWRTVGGWPSGADEAATGRARLLTVLGQLTGALFAVVILAQWTAAVMLPAHPVGVP
jgi:hypothetical protein